MKLSKETITILKNFATINSGIYFKQGSTISTVSPQKNILADAEISENIPKSFGIYDLNNFLSAISIYNDDVELEFDSSNVYIKGNGGRSKTKYRFTEASMIVTAPDKRPTLPSVDVSFYLSEQDLGWILRQAHVLGSPNIGIVSDGVKVGFNTFDVADDSANENFTELSEFDSGGNSYKLIFKTENLKMLSGNYDVEICSKGIAKFIGKTNNLVYYITLETSSQYN